jgi:COP9 signalosome complex subunit 1
MCLNVIKVSIQLQNWSHVMTYVAKAEGTPEFVSNSPIATKLHCAAGLSDLASKKYKASAKHFLAANFDQFVTDYGEILSANNVAVYGGLCALASFDRNELYKNVISSSSFKLFLELEPQLRDAITKFYNSKYAGCLSILDDMRDNLLLDIYLAAHVNNLYNLIRNRALIQYFSPYLSADMNKMASAFNTNVNSLEDEIMQLILEGQIQARIDSHNKILFAKDVDQRTVTFERAIEMGKEWQRRTKALILRSAMLKNGNIQVKSPPPARGDDGAPSGSGGGGSSGLGIAGSGGAVAVK